MSEKDARKAPLRKVTVVNFKAPKEYFDEVESTPQSQRNATFQ
jgi:hypothetical protein